MKKYKYEEKRSPDGSIDFIRPKKWHEGWQGDLIGMFMIFAVIAFLIFTMGDLNQINYF